MFLAIIAIFGIITAPLSIHKMEKANESYQERKFKEDQVKLEKEYGIPHRPTLGEIR